MPFFRYSARDAKGQPVEGTIQAPGPNEAVAELTKRGFGNPRLLDPAQIVGMPGVAAPAPQKAAPQKIRTWQLSDKMRFYLFAQISDQLRAGINPANAFSAIAAVSHMKAVRESLDRAGKNAAAGGKISEVLSLYPNLYPQHVAYTVMAGEEGGFLPAATMHLAEQSASAYKFKRFHWWLWFVAMNALLSIPLVLVVTRGMLKTWEKVDATGGAGGPLEAGNMALKSMVEVLFGPIGLITLLAYAVMGALYLYFSSPQFLWWRHKLGLYWPVLGRRARHEGLTTFTWVLSKMSNAGLSPWRSWEIAARSVPNVVLAKKLEDAGGQLEAGTKLSEILFKSNLFPQEYAPVIATGEMTGNVVGALERLAETTKTEFEAQTTYAKARTAGWGCLLMGVVGAIVLGILMLFMYYWLPEAVLKDFPVPE